MPRCRVVELHPAADDARALSAPDGTKDFAMLAHTFAGQIKQVGRRHAGRAAQFVALAMGHTHHPAHVQHAQRARAGRGSRRRIHRTR